MKTSFLQALRECQSIYFCGLVKNAGKTIALRQAMREARSAGKKISVTSVGRDGEAFDAIFSEVAKPILDFQPDDLVVTTEGLLPRGNVTTVLHRFRISSAMGAVVAARVVRSCTMEVAGPSTNSGLREVKNWLMASGTELLLVDGALDRKAASLPDLCSGLVVASGAAVSDDMESVLSQTRSAIDMLRLENDQFAPDEWRLSFSPIFDSVEGLCAVIVQATHKMVVIEVQGAVTERLLRSLMREKLFSRCRVVADCFAKVFIHRERWEEYRRLGLNMVYRRPTRVLSLTVNPVSPRSSGFDASNFLAGMRARIPEIPVFDLCMADYLSDMSE